MTDETKKKRKVEATSSNSKKKNADRSKKAKPAASAAIAVRPRRHADIVERGKILWNQLRQKHILKDDRRKLLDELIPLLMNAAPHEIALQHDGSRLVQAVLQFGTPDERSCLVTRLDNEATLLELAVSQYAHFVLLKIFKYCERPSWEMVTRRLASHLPMLAAHATASRVVEVMFQTIPKNLAAPLKQELYGPHVSLFYKYNSSDAKQMPTLAWNLEQHPMKTDVTVEFVRKLVLKGISKKLYAFSYFQSLLCELLTAIPASEIRSVMAPSLADSILQLVSTKSGIQASVLCISYATPKERKRMAKCLKGYTKSSLLHREHGYQTILRLVQVTDDTVAIQKNLLAEILNNPAAMLELAMSDSGVKLFLMLFHYATGSGEKPSFLDPSEQLVFFDSPEVDGVPTSKKDPKVRAQEHVDFLLPAFHTLALQHTEELLKTISGQAFMVAYYRFDPKLTLTSIPESLVHDPIGHRGIQKLVRIDKDRPASATSCTRLFLDGCSSLDGLLSSNRGAFCVVALKEAEPNHSIWNNLTKEIVQTGADASKSTRAGYEALLKAWQN